MTIQYRVRVSVSGPTEETSPDAGSGFGVAVSEEGGPNDLAANYQQVEAGGVVVLVHRQAVAVEGEDADQINQLRLGLPTRGFDRLTEVHGSLTLSSAELCVESSGDLGQHRPQSAS